MKGEVLLAFVFSLSAACSVNTGDQPHDGIVLQKHKPYCGSTEFYCPYDSENPCKPRSVRCLLESERTGQSCLNPETHDEEGCRGDLKNGVFEIWDGWTSLLSAPTTSVSRSHHHIKHEFVTYRGFTYEYNRRGIGILDTSDPYYRYKTKKVTKFTYVDSSRCKMGDLQLSEFFEQWTKKKYNIFTHNCQHFSDKLIDILKGNCNAALILDVSDTEISDVDHLKIQPFAENCSACSPNNDQVDGQNVDSGLRQEAMGSEVSFDYSDEYTDSDSTGVLFDSTHEGLRQEAMGSEVSFDYSDEHTDPDSTGVLHAVDSTYEEPSSADAVGFVVAGIGVALLAIVAMVVVIVIFTRVKRSDETEVLLGNSNNP